MRLRHLEGIKGPRMERQAVPDCVAATRDWLLWTPRVTKRSEVAEGSSREKCGSQPELSVKRLMWQQGGVCGGKEVLGDLEVLGPA